MAAKLQISVGKQEYCPNYWILKLELFLPEKRDLSSSGQWRNRKAWTLVKKLSWPVYEVC